MLQTPADRTATVGEDIDLPLLGGEGKPPVLVDTLRFSARR